jgi:hypothetical protein
MTLDDKVDRLTTAVDSLNAAKRAAIRAGVGGADAASLDGNYRGEPFLKSLADWRLNGNYEAMAAAKAVLGNRPGDRPQQLRGRDRRDQRRGQPVSLAHERADRDGRPRRRHPVRGDRLPGRPPAGCLRQQQGRPRPRLRLGHRDAYQIATIVDVGNQLLRHSEGAAEANVRRRLGKYFGLAEGNFIINGTGSSQPLGILQAILVFGDIAAHKYTLNSETRAAAIGNGVAKLEARGERASAVVMNPTDYWEMATETLGTSGAGGCHGSDGCPGHQPVGHPGLSRREPAERHRARRGVGRLRHLHRLRVPDRRVVGRGNRFDQNVTGFRAEEEFGFNAEPYVRTGKFVKILGL